MLGWIIFISAIIAVVCGWNFMVDLWLEFFEFIREFAGMVLDNAGRKERLI